MNGTEQKQEAAASREREKGVVLRCGSVAFSNVGTQFTTAGRPQLCGGARSGIPLFSSSKASIKQKCMEKRSRSGFRQDNSAIIFGDRREFRYIYLDSSLNFRASRHQNSPRI